MRDNQIVDQVQSAIVDSEHEHENREAGHPSFHRSIVARDRQADSDEVTKGGIVAVYGRSRDHSMVRCGRSREGSKEGRKERRGWA